MSYQMIIFNTIGGLGLFLFGMRMMSEGLQRVAGDGLRKILQTVSVNRVVACFTGTVVTALIQSSSATTVMLVGFVNAGLMNLTQATGVALGANIGTTVTAQLIAFKITDLALPAIALGVYLRLFARRKRWQEIGKVVLGFGLLFYGMEVMKQGVSPLKNSQVFVHFFTQFDASNIGGILLCVATGTVITMLLQSSSATVGLTITLAAQGLLSFPGAVALVLGDNIGTTITAELAAIGSDVNARRTARAHTMFNVLGVAYMVLLFPLFTGMVESVTGTVLGLGPADTMIGGEKPYIARYIANAHTLFNLVNAMVFLAILPLLVRAATFLTPGRAEEQAQDIMHPKYLDEHFLNMPSVALEQARQEVVRMGQIASDMLGEVVEALPRRDVRSLSRWRHQEKALDNLQREITNYLVRVSQQDISATESKLISSRVRMVNNIERIGDSVQNLAELAEEMIESDMRLSEEGLRDYQEISGAVKQFYALIQDSLRTGRVGIMDEARQLENAIDFMREDMRARHLMRLREGTCRLDPGLVFTDILNHFEKIGDYCFNVAQSVAGIK